jgi:NAD(P)-dependent dehydrogenase (short-subunit alcohol dehydrogenase family)
MNMNFSNSVALVTGGASGLGLATAKRLQQRGMRVLIVDLPASNGPNIARDLGDRVRFAAADVADAGQMNTAFDAAQDLGTLRALVHCAGRGGAVRLVERDGSAGSLETFEAVIRTNLVGTFNTLRLAAARMARNEPEDGDRGVCVLTASIAAYEGQIGQVPYASSKAGIVGMTLVAARDLANKAIRVCTIAPGLFDTPLLARLPEDVRASLGKSVPHPARLGVADEFAALAIHILENSMLNGETIRLDGALRMQPR